MEAEWRALWDAEVDALPSHTESRLWLVTGLLLPVWDRLPKDGLRPLGRPRFTQQRTLMVRDDDYALT